MQREHIGLRIVLEGNALAPVEQAPMRATACAKGKPDALAAFVVG